MALKTRDKLVEVARQLFARQGIENTTMSDIANASDKGRRTIYTYFKNKREIYDAVVERESEQIVGRLRWLVTADMPPMEKLERFIDQRIDALLDLMVHYNDNNIMIRSLLKRDGKRIEEIRYRAIEKEHDILTAILDEGVRLGCFNPRTVGSVFPVLLMIFQGLELSDQHNNYELLHVQRRTIRAHIKRLLVAGVEIDNSNA